MEPKTLLRQVDRWVILALLAGILIGVTCTLAAPWAFQNFDQLPYAINPGVKPTVEPISTAPDLSGCKELQVVEQTAGEIRITHEITRTAEMADPNESLHIGAETRWRVIDDNVACDADITESMEWNRMVASTLRSDTSVRMFIKHPDEEPRWIFYSPARSR